MTEPEVPHAAPDFAVTETAAGFGTDVADPAGEETAEPEPLGVVPVETGNAEVDALMRRLADADALPTDGHIEVYEDVHRGLRDTLTALDSRPGPPGPAPSPT